MSIQLFRLWLGAAEYLFRKPELLDDAIDTAIEDDTFRADDLEFTFAARVCISVPFLLCRVLTINAGLEPARQSREYGRLPREV